MRQLLLFLFILVISTVSAASDRRTRAIARFVQDPIFRHGAVAVGLYDAKSGKPVYEHNAHQALIPASTVKLASTGAALELFSPEFKFSTTLYHTGEIGSDGVLKGSLLVVGSGDPSLGSRFLSMKADSFLVFFVDRLLEAGVRSIEGEIVAVERAESPFDNISPKVLWEDVASYYGGGCYDLNIYDNNFSLRVVHDNPTDVRFILEPSIPGLALTNRLRVWEQDKDSLALYPNMTRAGVEVRGAISRQSRQTTLRGAIPDPPMLLITELRRELQRRGIGVSGNSVVRSYTQKEIAELKESAAPVAEWSSPSLLELSRETNFRSLNLYAEAINRLLTQVDTFGWSDGTICPLVAYWKSKGMNTEGVWLYDGSGLAQSNRVKASFIADVLVRMYRSPYSSAFVSTLPQVGKEGSVAGFFRTKENKGRIRLKSGSMSQVAAYAGYIDDGNSTYVLVLMINQFMGERRELNKKIERLLYSIQ